MLNRTLPRALFVYQLDEEKGKPVYVAVLDAGDIDDAADGRRVGTYLLKEEGTFRIKKEVE